MAVLTDAQRRDRALTELDFQRLIVGTKPPGLAVIFGWEHVHFRPAQTARGWRTPASGSLAAGWLDLFLVRPRDRRLIFAELKREGAEPTHDQERVLALLAPLAGDWIRAIGDARTYVAEHLRIEVHVWRPSDLTAGRIEEVLR